jgi:hypothetical protein
MRNMPFWNAEEFGKWRRSEKTDEELYLELLKSQQYQGWTGDGDATSAFITWAVALHLDNDQYWYDRVYNIIKNFGKNGKWDAVVAIKEFVEDADGDLGFSQPHMRQARNARQLLRGELQTKAEGAINWEEIYDHFEVDFEEPAEEDWLDEDDYARHQDFENEEE